MEKTSASKFLIMPYLKNKKVMALKLSLNSKF